MVCHSSRKALRNRPPLCPRVSTNRVTDFDIGIVAVGDCVSEGASSLPLAHIQPAPVAVCVGGKFLAEGQTGAKRETVDAGAGSCALENDRVKTTIEAGDAAGS